MGSPLLTSYSSKTFQNETNAPVYDKMYHMITTASFLASIPPIMSGIKTGGDGMRVQFDIPESEMGEAVKLLAMRGERLKVTVEVVKSVEKHKSSVNY